MLKMFEMDQVCKVGVSNSHITYRFPRMLCPYLIGQHLFPKHLLSHHLPATKLFLLILGNWQEEGKLSGKTGAFVSIKETSRTL